MWKLTDAATPFFPPSFAAFRWGIKIGMERHDNLKLEKYFPFAMLLHGGLQKKIVWWVVIVYTWSTFNVPVTFNNQECPSPCRRVSWDFLLIKCLHVKEKRQKVSQEKFSKFHPLSMGRQRWHKCITADEALCWLRWVDIVIQCWFCLLVVLLECWQITLLKFLSRWWFQIFVIFTPNLGEMIPNLTSIFFRWVETTN